MPPHETVHEVIQWILQDLEKLFQFDPYSELYYHYLQSIYIPGYGVKELPPPVLISPIDQLSQVFQNCDPNDFSNDFDTAVQDWDQSGYSHVTPLYNEPFVNDLSLSYLITPQRKATYDSLETFIPRDPNTLEYQTQVQSKMGSLNYNEQRLCLSSATDVTSVNTVPTQMDIITPEVLNLLAGDQYTHSTANNSISDSNNFVSVQNSLAPLHPAPLHPSPLHPAPLHPTYPAPLHPSPLHPAAAPFLPTSQLDDLTGFFFYILNNVAQSTIDDLFVFSIIHGLPSNSANCSYVGSVALER